MNEKPKYYKCIESKEPNQFTVNKIYKITNPDYLNNYENFIDDNGKPNGFAPYNDRYMTPVTELEWNLQEGITTPVSNEQNYDYLGPILEKLALEYDGKFILAKINVDENPENSEKYEISSIPSVKMFKDGEVVAEFLGAQPESQVRRWIDSNIK